MTHHSFKLQLLVLLGVLSWCVPAVASPEYPGLIQDELDMPCAPGCTICHRDNNGGVGTVVQPFGEAMFSGGLRLRRPDLIVPILQTVAKDGVDSDQDGVSDVDELSRGDNPNESGAGLLCATYGCGAQIAPPQRRMGGELLLFSTATVLLLFGQRTRRRRQAVAGAQH
jgi:hypothetical protein